MPGGGPEWVQLAIVDVVMYEADGRAQPARCQVGLVRMPSGDVLLASAIVGRPIVVIPPRSVVEIIGILREGLGRML